MRTLKSSEINQVAGATVSINVQPGETNIMMTEKSDHYRISFNKKSSYFFNSWGTLIVQGDGTYSWGSNLWGTPYPDFHPTQVNVENDGVIFKVNNSQ